MGMPPSGSERDKSGDGFEFCAERSWDGDARVADAAVDRVLVLGDIHNDAQVLAAALTMAALEGCDALGQVGDFWLQDASWAGYDPRWAELMWVAMDAPIPVVVIDGNHEVWPCLTRYLRRREVQAALPAGRPLHLGGSLWWADRGSTWTWSGARCGALGGAVSPDKWMPDVADERWPDEEATTEGDLERLLGNAGGGLDVLFCHDAPTGVRGLRSGLPWQVPADIEAQANAVRRLLATAVDEISPDVVFHGHWHQRNRERIRDDATEVFGLAADGWPYCCAVLSTATRHADYPLPRAPER